MTERKPTVDPAAKSRKTPAAAPDAAATMSQAAASIQTSKAGQATTSPSAAAATPVPTNFGRYKIEKELGKGAMGVVYLAEDTQLHRKVALKIPKQSSLDDPETLERFYREARTTATLRHANICPVFDVGDIDGTHYLTMAYIPGKPVSSYLGKKLPAAKQVALLIRKIALALEEAHKNGVVHRDLKPSNVMLDDRGEPIVMDFGLACQTNTPENARLTQSGAILGTPAYMAPEQVRGEVHQIGPASDIYALGVMLYQFLTGELPFTGPVMMVLAQIITEQPRKPSEIRPDVDPTLEAICLKMMAKEIDQRYAGMKEVVAALTEYVKKGTVSGLETVVPPSPEPTFEDLPDLPQVERDDQRLRVRRRAKSQAIDVAEWWKRARKQPWFVPVGAALGLVLIGIFAAVIYFQTGRGTVEIDIAEDDPPLQVEFAGDKFTIQDGPKSFRVWPTRQTMIVTGEGIETETNTFTMKRGESKRWSVRLSPERKIEIVDRDSPAKEEIKVPVSVAGTTAQEPGDEQILLNAPVGTKYTGLMHWYRPGSVTRTGIRPFTWSITRRDGDEVEIDYVLIDIQEHWTFKGQLVKEAGRAPRIVIRDVDLVDGEHPLEGSSEFIAELLDEGRTLRGTGQSETGWRSEFEGTLVDSDENRSDETSPDGTPQTVSRRRFSINGGEWSIDGDELVQADTTIEFAYLNFGDKNWTDFDFEVDAMHTAGRLSAALKVRVDRHDYYLFALEHGAQSLAEVHT